MQLFDREILDMSFNQNRNRLAVAGDTGIRIVDMSSFTRVDSEAVLMNDDDSRRVCGIAWSPEGQILSIATKGGVFLINYS